MIPRLIPYYGTKASIALKYPRPKYDTIIEPFAGAASYSLCYPARNVILYDKYERLIALWQYLIAVTPEEILSLPLISSDTDPQQIPNIPQEARDLIGWWSQPATSEPRKPSTYFRHYPDFANIWSPRCRQRIASIVPKIKHWQAYVGDYTDAPDIDATWFIDPPYQVKGLHYKHSSKHINYDHLADWCKTRTGQVMVCENYGASWLPFEPFSKLIGGSQRKSFEVIWTNDGSHKQQTSLF